jgi:transglutaminase-like putative cysteine protease
MISPRTPVLVDENVRLSYVGEGGYFTAMQRDGGQGPYQIAAQFPIDGNQPGQLNLSALKQTSTDYPPEIVTRFAAKPPAGSLGPNALALEAKILAAAGSLAPIDIANALWKELRSSTYAYDTDVRDLPCQGISTVECFATYKHGYCQHYARTMATILRDLGIPTRIVEGFLPGERTAGIETIRYSSAHEWVEVYFMGYGWVEFDPTGGNLAGQAGPLPSGPPAASGSPRPLPSGPAATLQLPRGDGGLGANRPGSGPTPGSVGPLIAVTLLLLLGVGGLAFVVWQRGPRGATTADAAYGMVTRIASRLGFGPRPAQTVYEYAGTLGEVLPDVRPELETVARAKVESVYAREVLGPERVEGLRAAQRRLRVALLRLVFRRRDRRRRRR